MISFTRENVTVNLTVPIAAWILMLVLGATGNPNGYFTCLGIVVLVAILINVARGES